MILGRIEGATRNLVAPAGWDKTKDGSCSGLAIRDSDVDGLPVMTSAWFPTPEELAALAAGAPILLKIVGRTHPPVMLAAGNPPSEGI